MVSLDPAKRVAQAPILPHYLLARRLRLYTIDEHWELLAIEYHAAGRRMPWARFRLLSRSTLSLAALEPAEGIRAGLWAKETLAGPRLCAALHRTKEIRCLPRYPLGRQPCPATGSTTEAWRTESDQIGRFIDECCVIGEFAQARARTLYSAYRKWAEDAGERPSSEVEFSNAMGRRTHAKRNTKSGMVYLGIGVSADATEG